MKKEVKELIETYKKFLSMSDYGNLSEKTYPELAEKEKEELLKKLEKLC